MISRGFHWGGAAVGCGPTCVIDGRLTPRLLGHLGGEGIHSQHFVELAEGRQPQGVLEIHTTVLCTPQGTRERSVI